MTEEEFNKLKIENKQLKEKLNNTIPKHTIEQIYNRLKSILESNITNYNNAYANTLIDFVIEIEKHGPQIADEKIKTAIVHLLSVINFDKEVG